MAVLNAKQQQQQQKPISSIKRYTFCKVPFFGNPGLYFMCVKLWGKKKAIECPAEQTNFFSVHSSFLFLRRLEVTKDQLLSKVFIL